MKPKWHTSPQLYHLGCMCNYVQNLILQKSSICLDESDLNHNIVAKITNIYSKVSCSCMKHHGQLQYNGCKTHYSFYCWSYYKQNCIFTHNGGEMCESPYNCGVWWIEQCRPKLMTKCFASQNNIEHYYKVKIT